eukprot:6201043-Pleurochrysis_carterae.AAC.3
MSGSGVDDVGITPKPASRMLHLREPQARTPARRGGARDTLARKRQRSSSRQLHRLSLKWLQPQDVDHAANTSTHECTQTQLINRQGKLLRKAEAREGKYDRSSQESCAFFMIRLKLAKQFVAFFWP